MKKNSDLIKQYSVKIESDFGKYGSGVLIKVDDSKCYLATAKHNFITEERDDSWKDVKKDFLEKRLSDISVSQYKNKICKIVNITSFCDGYDAIIFEVKDLNNEFKRLSNVNILYADDYGKEHEYFFHGYPEGTKDDSDEIIEKLYIKNNNEYKYTLGTNESFRQRGLKGFSGSGVFIRDNGRLYLVGIIIQRSDELSSFTAFNLPTYLNDKEPFIFLLKKNILDLENFEDMQDLIICRNYDNPLVQEYKNIFQGDKYHNSKLPDKSKEIGYLGEKFQITNQFIETEANFRKELADMYLLATMISKKFGEETLVKEYFKKAREYEPKYIRYLKNIDDIYSIDELMRDAKIALIENKLIKAKIFFEALLSLNINDSQRIYSYEKILEITKLQNNDIEIVKISKILLKLYSEEEKLKKAIIYYDLSMMNIDELEKFYNVEQGLFVIKSEITNPSFFEMEYKLKRRKNELFYRKEDVFQSEDSYLDLRNNLKKLSSKDKNYNGEYQQIILKESYKNIIYKQKDMIKKISTKILIGILIAIITLPFLLFILMNTLESKYKIDKNITNCSQRYMNGFKVEECNFIGDKNQAIIYDLNSSSKVIVLQGFPSAQSDFSQDRKIFLKDVFYYKIYNLDRVKNIKIYGHTDLEHYENNISSNQYLGKARAFKVKKIISKEMNRTKIEAQYNTDFFMRDTDKILNKTLLKVLGLNDEVDILIQKLKISKEDTVEQIRNYFKDKDLSNYRKKFTPFRSVIILINFKEESLWDKIQKKLYDFESTLIWQ